jgi:hypothetical protein
MVKNPQAQAIILALGRDPHRIFSRFSSLQSLASQLPI